MRLSTLFLLLVMTVIGAFAALNWTTFTTPTELSFGFTRAQMPLGLLMLSFLILLTAFFLFFVGYLGATALLEARRHSRELRANRELADQAEASRFTELRGFLEEELSKQAALAAETKSEFLARVERTENNLRTVIEQTGNSLAAYLGEIEDRIQKSER